MSCARWCGGMVASAVAPSVTLPAIAPEVGCGCDTGKARKLPPASTILVLLALGFAGGIWMAR